MVFCAICNAKMSPIFSMGSQPLANKYPKAIESFSDEIRREMLAFFCRDCYYINLPCDIDRSVFFEDYYYLSSVNRELVIHFEDFADHIERLGSRFVLDVGSNDGILLRPLRKKGIKCLGIDPSENVSRIANRAGLETVVGFFNLDTAVAIERQYGKPDLIAASSVFTHLDNPGEFFAAADSLLADRGFVVIEVEYLGSIIRDLGFERFYFDRPHYYSVKALSNIAERFGFSLSEVAFVSCHGGSVRAVFQKNSAAVPSSRVRKFVAEEESALNENFIREKFGEFELAGINLVSGIREMLTENKRIAAYGCPARFSTITNFCGIDTSFLPYVVDDSPLKSGRFSPGQHIPITSFSADDSVDVFIVFAYEYIESIRAKVKNPSVKYFKPIPFEPL